jgi:hypothetical protein
VGIQVKLHSRTDVIIVDGDQITYAEDGKVLEILNEGSEIIATFRDWEYAILQEPYERPSYRALDDDEEDDEDDDELYEDDEEEEEDDLTGNGNGSAEVSNEEIARVINETKLLNAGTYGGAVTEIQSEEPQS